MDLDPQVHNKRVLENLGWAVGSTRAVGSWAVGSTRAVGRVASDELYDLASGWWNNTLRAHRADLTVAVVSDSPVVTLPSFS